MSPVRALVLKSNDFSIAGAHRAIEMYLAHFDRTRVEPVLGHFASEDRPPDLLETSPRLADLEHHRISWPGLRRARSAARALAELIERTGVDLVTSNDLRTDLVCRLAGGGRGMGVPWAPLVHGWTGFKRRWGELRYGVYELLDRWCIRGADEVWVGSHACERVVRRHLPRRVPIVVKHNAVEPYNLQTSPAEIAAVRAGLNLAPDTVLVGTLGRMVWAKGHAQLAEAVVQSGCDNLVALLLGYGELEDELRAMSERPPYRGRVIVPGAKASLEQMPAHLGALDLFCFPSLQESLPLAVLEAMYMDNAVASSATGDLPLVLENGETGLLFPPGDVPAMARCLRTLVEDTELRERLRRRAKERVVSAFSAERYSKDIEDTMVALTLTQLGGCCE